MEADHSPVFDKALYQRALALLARREYSQAELRARLLLVAAQQARALGIELEAEAAAMVASVDAVLASLVEAAYVSDVRFTEQMVRHHARKFGKQRILHALRQKGVDGDMARAVLADLDGSELDRACVVWQKKYGVLPTDAASRGKQARFLQSRGFSFEVIAKVLAGIEEDA